MAAIPANAEGLRRSLADARAGATGEHDLLSACWSCCRRCHY